MLYQNTALKWIALLLLPLSPLMAFEPNWGVDTIIQNPRVNPYQLSDTHFYEYKIRGLKHALNYPVEVSGTLAPWIPIQSFLDRPSHNPLRALFQLAFEGFTKINSSDELLKLIGLHLYPKNESERFGDIPDPETFYSQRMGATFFKKNNALAMTISCAACHSSSLFGKKIIGLSNRFSRANEFFYLGKKAAKIANPNLFNAFVGSTKDEYELYKKLRYHVQFIGVKKPEVLGLDTSLAQVALSLARRDQDPNASLNVELSKNPRPEILSTFVADSKPAVWWNVKYKNRWLSDGSVISGNPIYTNILWNEIGRGTDLNELQNWLNNNNETIKELTTAVFSNEAPHYTDFFRADSISIERAKKGEITFNQLCSKCHGTYVKNWSRFDSQSLSLQDILKTQQVIYKNKTPVIDVGTDPNRYIGMESLAKGLNPLWISQSNGIKIQVQKGYVPPPLVGIWARWPYFHNNSAPNLCAVLTPSNERPKFYYSGEAKDPKKDFDEDCVGYPTGTKTPTEWKTKDHLYDTTKSGLSNHGHDYKIFIKDGVNQLNSVTRRDLIEFLKTL